MRKKLLTIVALLLFVATGAWAQEPTKYTVKMAEGTEDATNWTISPTEAAENTKVTATYSGTKRVKSVKAVVKAPTPPAPEGAINGKFSVGATKQVYFSKGNLYYDKYTNPATWSFFDNQYQFYTTSTETYWDKFGWVATTSTVLTSAPDKYGVSTSKTNSDYGSTITDTPNNWGETMGAGWRVLTDAEWTYLFNTRTTGGTVFGTASARYAQAEVNTDGYSTKGIILFPDGVDIDASEVNTPGKVNDTSDWGTKCTIDQWTALAAKGCVFLPAAGRRDGSSLNFGGTVGYYWTSSPYYSDPKNAYVVYFSSDNLHPYFSGSRYFGCSVRLVRDVQ